MVEFIHAADIHLDSPLHGLESYEGAPVAEIRNATRLAFDKLIDFAKDEKVDFVMFLSSLMISDLKPHSRRW